MLNTRSQTARAFDDQDYPAGAEQDETMAELARVADADIRRTLRRGPNVHEEIAQALERELAIPFAVETEPRTADAAARTAAHKPYDAWDDDALADLPDDFSFAEFEPRRIQEGVLPPHPVAEIEAAPRRSRWKLALAAALVTTALVGGAVFLMMPSGVIGEPILVRAPQGEYKIVPDAGDAIDEPVEGQAVFNAVNGTPPKSEERLVAREESVPELPPVTEQVNRVILPDGNEVDAGPALPPDAGPRRVRTVLVKPDGTIIDSPDGPVPSLPTPTQTAPITAGGPLVQPNGSPIDRLIAEDGPASSAGLPPLEADNTTLGGEAAPVAPNPDSTVVAALPPVVGQTPADVAAETLPAADVAQPAEAAAPAVIPPRPPQRPVPPAASSRTDGPLDLAVAAQAAAPAPAAAAPAPAAETPPAAAPAASAGAYVQIVSTRSESETLSTFASLQRRYAAVLGGQSPDIQRADIPGKGVYYRARVPAASREAAVSLCERLKAAGGDCLIARN